MKKEHHWLNFKESRKIVADKLFTNGNFSEPLTFYAIGKCLKAAKQAIPGRYIAQVLCLDPDYPWRERCVDLIAEVMGQGEVGGGVNPKVYEDCKIEKGVVSGFIGIECQLKAFSPAEIAKKCQIRITLAPACWPGHDGTELAPFCPVCQKPVSTTVVILEGKERWFCMACDYEFLPKA